MNNFLRVMALDEPSLHRVVFVNAREEGGINFVYDPDVDAGVYQVFIHNRFPYQNIESQEFASFAEARSFAARRFQDWEMLAWDQNVKRPCADGGRECGSGTCETCRTGGGCGDSCKTGH